MTAESSTHTYESGVQETVTLRRGPATPHDCALLKITYSDGEIADCYVNTAWLRDRADHLTDTPRPLTADDMTFEDNHAGRDPARERLDGWKTEWERRIDAEQKLIDLQAEVNELWPYRKRAEKAEEERDEARRYECSDLDAHWRLGEALASLKEANATVASLRAEQPRPLTADDITDEMVVRAQMEWERRNGAAPIGDTIREILTAALTPPPTRPEGAEKVEAVLHQYWSGDINGDDLANRIAEEMNR